MIASDWRDSSTGLQLLVSIANKCSKSTYPVRVQAYCVATLKHRFIECWNIDQLIVSDYM